MRIVSRMIVLGALGVQFATTVLGVLVFFNAKTLGNAALIAESDAYILLAGLVLSLLATTVLAIKLWRGSRRRKRYERAAPIRQ